MSIDKNKIITQDEMGEPAPMDKAEQRVEAEMKKLEERLRKKSRRDYDNKTKPILNDQPFSASASSSAALI